MMGLRRSMMRETFELLALRMEMTARLSQEK